MKRFKARQAYLLFILILSVFLITGCGGGENTTGHWDGEGGDGGGIADTTAPTVTFTDPANSETGVAFNKKIAATFSEVMDPLTITTATFTLQQGLTSVSGTVTYSGVTAVFTPTSNLAASTTYTATITAGTEDLAGNALAANYIWSFTTGADPDTTAPTVTFTDPANSETGVAFNKKISATFSEAVNPLTITNLTFTLKQGVTPVSGNVTYSGVTAVFTPTSNLAASTTYTATITAGTEDLAGNALAANYIWSFTTGADPDTTAPTVTFTDPANSETGVAFNKKISATFSEVMDPLTITNLTFTLQQGVTPVSGNVTYSGVTAVFTPTSNLAASTTYTATITAGTEDLAGNALAANYIWSFTTGADPDTSAPTVTFTDPANSETGVAFNKKIVATFSEVMDPLTITNLTFTLQQGVTPVSGTVTYSGVTAVFTPTSNLAASTTYTATITAGAKDLAGNALAANYIWSFTTGTATDTTAPTVISTGPFNGDIGVCINKKISATFSEAMDPLTITNLTFTLKQGVTPVSGNVTYSGVTAVFTPTSNLAASTTYTATITNGAKDLAGNALVGGIVPNPWTFTTGTTICQMPVPLGSSASFAILASAAITNIPTSEITGDVGLTPDTGANITGFSNPLTCPEVTGTIYAVDAAGPACATIDPVLLQAAKNDAESAFIYANAAARGTPAAISGNLNGLTLYPGLYESGTTLSISAGGHLYLDAQGDVNAVFIIRSATSITTLSTSEVHLTGGAKAINVFWTAGSAVTLGTNSIMKGTMIAGTAETLQTGANLEGRALNQGAAAAAITCDACTITLPLP